MSYRLPQVGRGVVRASDGAVIPEDARNRDWREFLEWQAAGGVAAPADAQPTPDADDVAVLVLARTLIRKQIITRADIRQTIANMNGGL